MFFVFIFFINLYGKSRKNRHKKKRNPASDFSFLAEREGFEPPVPLSTTVFKTVVIDHSTISPCLNGLKAVAKLMSFLLSRKFFFYFFACLLILV